MFHLLKSNLAFNRTSAHPLDAAVRIAHHENDLIALHYKNKSRAVIFKRPLSEAVKADICRYQSGLEYYERFAPLKIRGPKVEASPFGVRTKLKTVNKDLRACPALIEDMAHVSGIFRRANGRFHFSAPDGVVLAKWFADMNDDEIKHKCFLQSDPHIDENRDIPDQRHMTCAYTEDVQAMGTGWFPGSFSLQEAEQIKREYLRATDPKEVLRKYNHQTTDAGDILFFHTMLRDKEASSTTLSLLHNSPLPPIGKARLCLLLPT